MADRAPPTGRPSLTAESVPLELVTHSRVTIARPAGAIWPHVVDPDAWKQGARLVPHGDRLAAVGPDGEPMFLADEVELVPEARRTIRLTSLDGTLLGWSSWYLEPRSDGTLVGYDVYSLVWVPAGEGSGPGAVAEFQKRYRTMNQERFDAELLELKRLMEEPSGCAPTDLPKRG